MDTTGNGIRPHGTVDEDILNFITNIFHEIKTPVNCIVGFARLMAEADSDEERQKYLNAIEENNSLTTQLLEDIAALIKMDQKKIQVNMQRMELGPFFDTIQCEAEMRNPKPDVEIILDKPKVDITINTDRLRLTQIVNNLINNALKFTNSGFIRIGYHAIKGAGVYISISDTGIGIPKDKLDAIFERYVRLDSKASGYGLGLEITKRLVEMLGGTIGIESQLGQGTTFFITLPHAENAAATPTRHVDIRNVKPATPPQNTAAAQDPAKKTVLVAEDDNSNYMLDYMILRKKYNVKHAWNGAEAVEMVKQQRPDAILMDIKMPVMNGYEAHAAIRKIDESIPIIALTAFTLAEEEEYIMEQGFDAYLPKPVNAEKLAKIVKEKTS